MKRIIPWILLALMFGSFTSSQAAFVDKLNEDLEGMAEYFRGLKKDTVVVEEVITVTHQQLIDEYRKGNIVAFENKYEDKTLVVTGVVSEVKKVANKYLVTFAKAEPQIHCYFSKEHKDQLLKLLKGTELTVKGERCKLNLTGEIRLKIKDCQIIK